MDYQHCLVACKGSTEEDVETQSLILIKVIAVGFFQMLLMSA